MPDKVFTAKEANPPDKVFPTTTDNLLDFGENEVVFQNMGFFVSLLNQSKQQGKPLIINCRRIRIETGGA